MPERASKFSDLLKQIAELVPEKRNIYLVGGAVRDFIIKRPIHDWDFVMEGDVRPISKKVADYFRGAYYLLDEERYVTRVILFFHGEKMVLDFASYRAESFYGDLEKRDFTINAMAFSIFDAGQLIDPLGGFLDLQNRVLRYCYNDCFKDDPARVMRGIRLLLTLDLTIDEKTHAAMLEAVPLLPSVSMERKRDEFFKIIGLGQTRKGVNLLDKNGILEQLIPETGNLKGVKQSPPHVYDVWEHTLFTLHFLDELLNRLLLNPTENFTKLGMDFPSIEPLLKFQPRISEHFREDLSARRPRQALLLFSALCHDLGKPRCLMHDEHGRIRFLGHEQVGAEMTQLIAERMALSNDEVGFSRLIVEQHMRIHAMTGMDHLPDRRVLHRYFRHTGEQGIDICLLSLADCLATWGGNVPPKVWLGEIAICEMLMETWFEKNEEVINPKRLLSGNEIIEILQIKPGPGVGKVVLALKEAQGAGEVLTVQDAVNYIKDWFGKQVEGEDYDDISSN